jgi:hypothetical protein
MITHYSYWQRCKTKNNWCSVDTHIHQRKGKLGSENRPHTQILLHILYKLSVRLMCNLPLWFEQFNDVIVSSQHLKNVFSHQATLLHLIVSHWSSKFQSFRQFFELDFKNILNYLIPWHVNYTQACTTPIPQIKTLRVNTIRFQYIATTITSSIQWK